MSTITFDNTIQSPREYVGGGHWFALTVRGRYEKTVARNLADGGYDAFLPLHTCARRWSDRMQKVELLLFPNYVFCRCESNDKLPILKIPGVLSFVGMGKKPQPVDESEMNSLQTVVRSGLLLKPWPFLNVGQRVIIQEGPLCNVQGLVAEVRDKHQLIVNITLLQRAVGVSIERSWIRPMEDQESSDGPRRRGPASGDSQTLVSRQGRSA